MSCCVANKGTSFKNCVRTSGIQEILPRVVYDNYEAYFSSILGTLGVFWNTLEDIAQQDRPYEITVQRKLILS